MRKRSEKRWLLFTGLFGETWPRKNDPVRSCDCYPHKHTYTPAKTFLLSGKTRKSVLKPGLVSQVVISNCQVPCRPEHGLIFFRVSITFSKGLRSARLYSDLFFMRVGSNLHWDSHSLHVNHKNREQKKHAARNYWQSQKLSKNRWRNSQDVYIDPHTPHTRLT